LSAWTSSASWKDGFTAICPITADDYGGIACARAHAAGALGRKRQADRRAYEVGLLPNEWDSLLSAV